MKAPLAIIDMDGTVRDVSQCGYPRAHEVRLVPGIRERLLALKQMGYVLVGASNQGGVGRKEISEDEVRAANDRTQELLGEAALHRIYYCPHYGPADGRNCDCKKPAPGMVLDALDQCTDTTLNGAVVVGDDAEKDGGLARGLALAFIHVRQFLATAPDRIEQLISVRAPATIDVADPAQVLGMMLGLAIGSAMGLAACPTSGGVSTCYQYTDDAERALEEKRQYPWTHDTSMAMMIAHAYSHPEWGDPCNLSLRSFLRFAGCGLGYDDFPWLVCRPEYERPGRTVFATLFERKAPAEYYKQHSNEGAGNGGLVRCAPIILYYLNSLAMLIADSRRSARLTHADPRPQSACVILNLWLREILVHKVKDARRAAVEMLPGTERCVWQRLSSIEGASPDEITGRSYVVSSLEAAAWSFLTTDSYRAAIEKAISLGGDADSIAAITGALAGAYYGAGQMPTDSLQFRHTIERLSLTAYCKGLHVHETLSKHILNA